MRKVVVGLTLVLILSGCGGTSATGPAASNETEPEMQVQVAQRAGLQVTDVAFGDGRFVAVTKEGTLLRQGDDGSWKELRALPADSRAEAIAFGKGQFVVFGAGSQVASSADGLKWTEPQTLVPLAVNQAASLNGKPAVIRSAQLNAIAAIFDHERFVTAAMAFVDTVFVTSVDGVEWQQSFAPSMMRFHDLTGGAGGFVAVGSSTVLFSSDGQKWNAVMHGQADLVLSDLYTVAYGAGRYVAGGRSQLGDKLPILFQSADGRTWTVVPGEAPAFRRVRYAADRQRFYGVTDSGDVMVSVDGESWSKLLAIDGQTITTLAYGEGRLAIFTEGRIYHVALPPVERS